MEAGPTPSTGGVLLVLLVKNAERCRKDRFHILIHKSHSAEVVCVVMCATEFLTEFHRLVWSNHPELWQKLTSFHHQGISVKISGDGPHRRPDIGQCSCWFSELISQKYRKCSGSYLGLEKSEFAGSCLSVFIILNQNSLQQNPVDFLGIIGGGTVGINWCIPESFYLKQPSLCLRFVKSKFRIPLNGNVL